MPTTTGLSAVEKIDTTHDVSAFDCTPANAGEEELADYEALNRYLKRFALTNSRAGGAQTYVVHRGGRVVGYYSICPGSVTKAEAPDRVGRGLGDYPVGVILLARLAVHQEEHGKRLGEALLKDALTRITAAADIISGRAVLVHALNSRARAFWEKYGFERCPVDDLRLMLLMKDLRAALRR